MSSRAWVESPRLETHLDWLLRQLEPHGVAIRGLLESGVTADLYCYSSGSSDMAPSLPRTIRDRADNLGIGIDVEYYQESPDD